MIWYGFGRFFIEGLRTDSLYFFKSVFGETIRVSQVVGAVIFVIGIIAMIIGLARAKDKALDDAAYDRVYSSEKDSIIGVINHEEENYDVKPSEEKTGTDEKPESDKKPEAPEETESENKDGKDN